MDKMAFKAALRRAGYSVDGDVDIPTVLLVDATKEEIKQKFYEVKLFAQKVGYHHTISVKNLKEDNNGKSEENSAV